MTGITDLKDLNNNNVEHYKRVNLALSLENQSYEVFGSIISENNTKLEEIYVNFGLYDFNGFFAIIKKSEANIDITKCYVLWMIIGIPSKLSVFSSKNRDFQVKYFEKSITFHFLLRSSSDLSQRIIRSLYWLQDIYPNIIYSFESENKLYDNTAI